MSIGKTILASVRQQQNLTDYRKTHWEGSFEEYLDIVSEHPEVTRTAYQRLYDMIVSHGTEEVFEHKEKIIRYRFFTEYAARLGFEPHPAWSIAQHVLPPRPRHGESIEFGRDGKPCYVAGAENDELILTQLESKLGPDAFNVLLR